MHSKRVSIAVLLVSSVILAAAADLSFTQAFTTWFGWKYVLGVENARAAYKSCIQFNNDRSWKTSELAACFTL
jgi:hypothetical protein